MAIPTHVEVGVRVGGKVQVKKFDIQADYEYFASERLELEDGDDPEQVINEMLDILKIKILEPKGQTEFESLWNQRLSTEAKKSG